MFREEARLRSLEPRCLDRFWKELESWQKAAEIRDFLADVRTCALASEKDSPELARWMEWAERIAAGFGPAAGGVRQFLSRYEFDPAESTLKASSLW
jgi:hypothetical protein